MDSIHAFGLSRPGFNPSHQQKFISNFSFKLEEMSFGEVFQWRNDFGEMFQWGKEENLGAMGDHFKLIRITLASIKNG
jgi:hypothetical protein